MSQSPREIVAKIIHAENKDTHNSRTVPGSLNATIKLLAVAQLITRYLFYKNTPESVFPYYFKIGGTTHQTCCVYVSPLWQRYKNLLT